MNEEVLGAEADEGDVLIVKSGTDFRDLSEFTLELEDTPEGSVRRKLIKSIHGMSEWVSTLNLSAHLPQVCATLQILAPEVVSV